MLLRVVCAYTSRRRIAAPRIASFAPLFRRRPVRKGPAGRRAVGFALIELLVVVLIVSTLLSISIPLYLSTVRNAAIRVVQSNLRMIAQAGQTYYVKSGHYPASIGDIVGPGKDIESISGPQGVTYSIDDSGGNGGGNGQGTPGNNDGQGNPGNPTGGASGLVIQATENGTDVFGSSGTADTATYSLADNSYSGL